MNSKVVTFGLQYTFSVLKYLKSFELCNFIYSVLYIFYL